MVQRSFKVPRFYSAPPTNKITKTCGRVGKTKTAETCLTTPTPHTHSMKKTTTFLSDQELKEGNNLHAYNIKTKLHPTHQGFQQKQTTRKQ